MGKAQRSCGMNLMNSQSPEMARFLYMMLLARSDVLEKKVRDANEATDRIEKLNSEVNFLNEYLDSEDCSYMDRKETESDILSIKNEIRILEQNVQAGKHLSVRARQVRRTIYELHDIIEQFEEKEKQAKKRNYQLERDCLLGRIDTLLRCEKTKKNMQKIEKQQKRIQEIENYLRMNTR